jgi:hypothetical protein
MFYLFQNSSAFDHLVYRVPPRANIAKQLQWLDVVHAVIINLPSTSVSSGNDTLKGFTMFSRRSGLHDDQAHEADWIGAVAIVYLVKLGISIHIDEIDIRDSRDHILGGNVDDVRDAHNPRMFGVEPREAVFSI